jgi:hypothetical protein
VAQERGERDGPMHDRERKTWPLLDTTSYHVMPCGREKMEKGAEQMHGSVWMVMAMHAVM